MEDLLSIMQKQQGNWWSRSVGPNIKETEHPDGKLAFEYLSVGKPDDVWLKMESSSCGNPRFLYVGERFKCRSETGKLQLNVLALRQCSALFRKNESRVVMWNNGMVMRFCDTNQVELEACVSVSNDWKEVKFVDIVVRGPAYSQGEIKRFLGEIERMFTTAIYENSPTVQLEKRYLCRRHITEHKAIPISYSQEDVDAARMTDGVVAATRDTETVQDSLIDLLAVDDDHLILKLKQLAKCCKDSWIPLGQTLLRRSYQHVIVLTSGIRNEEGKFCHIMETWIRNNWRTATLAAFLTACDRVATGLRRQIEQKLEITAEFSAANYVDSGGSATALERKEVPRQFASHVVRDGEKAQSDVPRIECIITEISQFNRYGRDRHKTLTIDGGDITTYEGRLQTFKRWPSWAAFTPEDLAKEGFYYTGIRDEVRCFRCDHLLRLLTPGDNIRQRHQRYSPNCPFLLSMEAADLRDMKVEDHRLRTFRNFPSSCPVRPSELARAGFYATGSEDGAQCFSCGISLKGWEAGDTAEGEHRRHNPYCPFLNGLDRTNVPLHGSATASTSVETSEPSANLQYERSRLATFRNWPTSVPVSREDLAEAGFYYAGDRDCVICFSCHVRIDRWVPGDVPVEEHIKFSPDCDFARAVAQRKQRYAIQATPNADETAERMKSYEQRMASFQDWPATAPISIDSLARAGFYYLGSGDRVKCFSCGGALKGWQRGDTAWGEHSKYFPSCDFVQQQDRTVARSRDEPWSEPSAPTEPPSLQSSSTNESNLVEQAVAMGFPRDLARRVIEQQQDSRHLSYDVYLDALLHAGEQEDKVHLPTASQVMARPSSLSAAPHSTASAVGPTAPPASEASLRELEHLPDSCLCKVCLERDAVMLFLPCAHILCCEVCAGLLIECPICRTVITQKIRTYFS